MSLDEAISRLRRLTVQLPKPKRLPTAAEVEGAERELGVTFHPDLRRFLLEASNVVYGTKEPVTLTVGDYTDLRKVARKAWQDKGIAKQLIPICYDGGDFYFQDPTGAIVYRSADGATEERWENLETWIREAWIGGSFDGGLDDEDE